MHLNKKIEEYLYNKGIKWIRFVDISDIDQKRSRGYPAAIIFGVYLSREYLQKVADTKSYVKNMVKNNEIGIDEFHLMEKKTDLIADELSGWISSLGYSAYSQSEDNILKSGLFDEKRNRTPLPHKAIALRSGMGWIGKNDLLITPEYGCGLSMCSVLTDAPIETVKKDIQLPLCGECQICVDICPTGAISGKLWESGTDRDELIDASKCLTCLECMVFCTLRIIKKH